MPAPPPSLRAALQRARQALASSDTAALDAQVLLAWAMAVERAYLFTHPERALSPAQQAAFQSAIQRRAAGLPLAYIVGEKGFYDVDLRVSPAVLIPRPETELLLEEALRLSDAGTCITAADIGTGSGALAVTFARQRPAATVYATDISREALVIARENATRCGAPLTLLQGDLAQPLIERGLQVDLLLANLPYIASDELPALAVSRYEPRLALDGGGDGLELIRRLLAQIPAVCREGAWVLLELGAEQGESVRRLVHDCLGARCRILRDYADLDRIARFQVSQHADARRVAQRVKQATASM